MMDYYNTLITTTYHGLLWSRLTLLGLTILTNNNVICYMLDVKKLYMHSVFSHIFSPQTKLDNTSCKNSPMSPIWEEKNKSEQSQILNLCKCSPIEGEISLYSWGQLISAILPKSIQIWKCTYGTNSSLYPKT